MFAVRLFRSQVAGWLFALVLLNGLACSFGHGQMMAGHLPGAKAMAPMQMQGHDMAGMHDPAPAKAPMPGMGSPFDNCFFAGSLPLGLFLFAALAWLLRTPRQRPAPFLQVAPRPPRHGLPALNPQAP